MNRSILIVLAPLMMTLGCGGGGSSSAPPNVGGMLGSLPVNIPGMNSAKAQQGAQLIQVGAKGLDVMSIDSPKRQQQIGQSVAVAIINRYPLSTDQALQDYVNLVGLTVASVAPNSEIDYAFGVLETQDVGAYSAPGGYIFITRGALAMIQDESELAGVLAHEVAHVAHNHGIEAVKASKGADFLVSAAKTQNQQVAAFGSQSDAFVDAIMVKGYSRSMESQADTDAVKYLAAAGYDPAGLERFLQRLQTRTGPGGGMQQVMSTHPGTAERVAHVQQQVAAMNARGVTLKERFAANVK
ncbi:MAG TPA: M48 family metalloprotease [Tepidisphaeraceae bacterium]|jgi:predicted Zn-dependent protease